MMVQPLGDPIYRPLPHNRCTRVLEILQSNPTEHNKLVIRMTVVDVGQISSLLHRVDEDEETSSDNNEQRFDALSYTWGAPLSTPECEALYDSTNDVSIVVLEEGVNEHSMRIGRNLYEALLEIYTATQQRPLWVDAICINQTDLREKEKHILLMSEIYSKAQRVIVWLGKDDHINNEFEYVVWFHTTVLDAIENFTEQTRSLSRADFMYSNDRNGVEITAMDSYLLPSEALNALYRFYARRRYFSRAWVMQEVALSNECVVLLGGHEVDFERLSMLPRQFHELGGFSSMYIQGGSYSHPATGTELAALGTNALQIHGWNVSTMVSDLCNIFGAYDDTTTYLALLEYQLSQGSQRLSTNPVDLIYCLLGMAKAVHPNVEDPIQPNYAATVDYVYTQFTTVLLETLPYRTILSLVTEKPLHADYVQRLPSWVPDFVTSIGADDPQYSYLKIQDRTLSLFARRCGQVDFSFRLATELGGSLSAAYMRDISLMTSIMKASTKMVQKGMSDLLEPMFRVICWGSLSVEKDEDFRILWRTLMAATVLEPEMFLNDEPEILAATSRLKSLFDSLAEIPSIPSGAYFTREEKTLKMVKQLEKLYDEEGTEEQVTALIQELKMLWPEHFSNTASRDIDNDENDDEDLDDDEMEKFFTFRTQRVDPRAGEHDTFFTTSKRNVGRVSATLHPGDELWLLCQAKVPFVLRPTPTTGEYLLIGEAFVHNAMMGELIKDGIAGQPKMINIV